MPDHSLVRHDHTLLTLAETATDRRFDMPFRKTFGYDGDFINNAHRALADRLHDTGMIDIGIDGWLLPADAQKLYEMAYLCPATFWNSAPIAASPPLS